MGSSLEAWSGLACLRETWCPFNWLFAPLLPLYLGGNLLMLASPLVVARWPGARAPWGALLLMAFALSLTAPVCAAEVQGTLPGAYLWMASFLFVGLGCILLPADRAAAQPQDLAGYSASGGAQGGFGHLEDIRSRFF